LRARRIRSSSRIRATEITCAFYRGAVMRAGTPTAVE
jgi:hypothetical protein